MEKVSVKSEASNEEVHSKKGSQLKSNESPCPMTIEQIQDLIGNTVEV